MSHEWWKELDREAEKLAENKVTPRRELRALREEGWVNGRRETAKEGHRRTMRLILGYGRGMLAV